MLAGGAVYDICFAFGVAIGSFYAPDEILWRTLQAIDKHLKIEFPSNDRSTLEAISEGFLDYTHGRMKGCVVAMDVWVCRTRQPFRSEVSNVISYRNRKNLWGMVCFAGCDHRGKLLIFSARCSGSTNDAVAW